MDFDATERRYAES